MNAPVYGGSETQNKNSRMKGREGKVQEILACASVEEIRGSKHFRGHGDVRNISN